MGSYSVLKVGTLQIDSCKDDIDPAVMMLFVHADKRVTPISLDQWQADGGEAEQWSIDRCEVEYRCSASQMVDRLELKGFTLAVAEEAFRRGARRRIKELTDSLNLSQDLLAEVSISDPDPHYIRQKEMERRTLEIFHTMTPADWTAAIRSIRHSTEERTYVEYADVQDLPLAQQYVRVRGWTQFGFPGYDLAVCYAWCSRLVTTTTSSLMICPSW